MKKFAEFEKKTINQYKRDLITFEEAHNMIFGYLKCMVDMDMLPEDRLSDEFTISVKKLLGI